jgi:creatinine amidohydrolase/Fe(II)-dependent formamide hydrolase-like protein
MDEVRYHLLRPAQIVKRRQACPVAYVPLGTIEWHGTHNPTGAGMNARESTPEFGKEIFEAAADTVVNEVRHRLNNRQTYMGHGMSLAEGLWKKEK